MRLNTQEGVGIVLLAAAWASSPLRGADPHLDHDVCQTDSTRATLCFDLRNDSHPTAGIVLNLNGADGKEHRLFLPFATSAFEGDRSLLATWGAYDDFTLIAFESATPGSHVLAIAPIFDGDQDSMDDRRSRSALSFVRSGLERHFVYRHSDLSAQGSVPVQAKELEIDNLDLVGIARPKTSTGLEVANGRIEDPAALFDNGRARFYPARNPEGKPSRIELRYQVQPTSWETLLLSNLAKLAGALAAPLVTILFFTVNEDVRPRTRRAVLVALVGLQIGIALWLGYLAWSTRNEAAASAAIADWIVVLVTAAVTGLTLWLKRERQVPSLAVRP